MPIISCNVCGGTLSMRLPTVRDPKTQQVFSLLECPGCGLGHTAPQPEDLGPYYDETYYGGRHGFTADYCVNRRMRFVSGAKRPSGRLLDVGCGEGTFLLAARNAGWEVAGTEINPAPALRSGLNVRSSIDAFQDAPPFDCITLWHSLEHMSDPTATIAKARKLLNPNGMLFIAVPDAAGLQASVFGPDWLHLDVPRHLYHFNCRSMRELLQQNGFEIVESWHQEFEYDLLGWSQSAINKMSSVPNIFFDRLTHRPSGGSPIQTVGAWIGGILFSLLALPLLPLGALTGRGGTLVVAARPKK